MIVPNKAVPINESALGLAAVILEQGPGEMSIHELYDAVCKHFESVDHFVLTMDVLYVLNRIDLNPVTHMVTYAP